MGNDECILCRRRGRLNLPLVPLGKNDGVQLALKVEAEAKELLKVAPISLIAVERDGPGGSCADQLKYGPFSSVVRALHTGTRLRDDRHYNLRAWLHTQALEYLKEGDPCTPYDPILFAQATGILAGPKGGLLLIESKEEYRKRLSGLRAAGGKYSGKSPDRWDAFVLSFTPPAADPIRSTAPSRVMNTAPSWRPLDAAFGY